MVQLSQINGSSKTFLKENVLEVIYQRTKKQLLKGYIKIMESLQDVMIDLGAKQLSPQQNNSLK